MYNKSILENKDIIAKEVIIILEELLNELEGESRKKDLLNWDRGKFDLEKSGINSLDFIKMVINIERKYNIEIPENLLVYEDMALCNIVDYVSKVTLQD